jgi:aminopeptidase
LSLDAARFAELLCGYCLAVQPEQYVLVRSSVAAGELLLELQREILERGAWPMLRVELPGQNAAFYAHAGEHHLDTAPKDALDEVKRMDATVSIQAPTEAF